MSNLQAGAIADVLRWVRRDRRTLMQAEDEYGPAIHEIMGRGLIRIDGMEDEAQTRGTIRNRYICVTTEGYRHLQEHGPRGCYQ